MCLENGLSLRARGNGFVFVSDKIHVKASSVDRGLSKKNLEMRLGSFEEYHENLVMPAKVYRRKPLARGHEKLWRAFQKEKAESSGNRQQIQEDRQKMFDSALQDFRLRNFLINQMTERACEQDDPLLSEPKEVRQQARKDPVDGLVAVKQAATNGIRNRRKLWPFYVPGKLRGGKRAVISAVLKRNRWDAGSRHAQGNAHFFREYPGAGWANPHTE